MTPASKDELREEIHAAFAGRPYPGDENLALRQPGCPGYEGDDVARFFRGKDWREITLESILNGSGLDRNAFMFFMTSEGFVYYLPAFLAMSLDVDGPFDFGEPLAFLLTPPPEGEKFGAWRDHFAGIVSFLTPEERQAVVHVLEYLASEYERRRYTTNQARMALDSYWAEAMQSATSEEQLS
jgi:hypothetical protein